MTDETGDTWPWPPGWCGLAPGQARAFLDQLARELGPDHALAPAIRDGRVRAVGTATGSDDVVYALAPGVMATPLALVHLAWPAPDSRPRLLRWLFPRPQPRHRPAVEPLASLDDLARLRG